MDRAVFVSVAPAHLVPRSGAARVASASVEVPAHPCGASASVEVPAHPCGASASVEACGASASAPEFLSKEVQSATPCTANGEVPEHNTTASEAVPTEPTATETDIIGGEPTVGGKRKHNEPKEKLSLKQRHQKTHPDKEDRLCSFVLRGDTCPYPNCQYSHDIMGYLAKKPADLGPICVNFEKFGHCASGLTCRFGDAHIDRETGRNLSRSDELGGSIERTQINILKKPTQLLLRKKKLRELCQSATPYDQPVKLVDFRNKVYVAPLTTVGNLPFRRVMKDFGADITCGEMAMASNILGAQASEWALLRRHESEDSFGVQVAGPYPNIMGDLAQLLEHEVQSDFVDLNAACPIDVVYSRGSGSALMQNHKRLCDIVKTMAHHLPSRSVTVKVRIGHDEKNPTTHKLMPMLQAAAPGRMSAVMIHGRSKLQRYHKSANWDYVYSCAKAQDTNLPLVPVIGNGDIFSFGDWKQHLHMMTDYVPPASSFVSADLAAVRNEERDPELLGLCSCAMLGRGALIKPWLPMEIKEQRLLDISAPQRLDMLRSFCTYGLEHWGSDNQGVATTRRFLLEWLSFLHRYVPVGVLEHTSGTAPLRGSSNSSYLGQKVDTVAVEDVYAQTMNLRPPAYRGRCDMETLLASPRSDDWIRISEMFLGPVKEDFHFIPKHKSNSYATEAAPTAGSGEIPVNCIEEDENNG